VAEKGPGIGGQGRNDNAEVDSLLLREGERLSGGALSVKVEYLLRVTQRKVVHKERVDAYVGNSYGPLFVALKPGTEYDISFQLSPPTRRSKGR